MAGVRETLAAALAVTLTAGTLTLSPHAIAHAAKPHHPPRPSVARVKPATGPAAGGTRVKLRGQHLSGATKVLFGSARGTQLQVKNDHKVLVTAPRHSAGRVDVRVVTQAGTSRATTSARFTYTSSGSPGQPGSPGGPGAPVSQAPTIASLTPAAGPLLGLNTISVTGDHFGGTTSVSFGSLPAVTFQVTSATTMTAVAPPGVPGVVAVKVTTALGTSAAASYTYVAPPGPLLVATPPTGHAGTAVKLTGLGLSTTTSVTFDGVASTTLTVVSDTEVDVTAPAHAVGPAVVLLTTPGGTTLGAFIYLP